MITEDFVSFETAKLLKEKGFEAYTLMVYKLPIQLLHIDKEYLVGNNNGITKGDSIEILAPTHQMVMKWLREVHKLHIAILWDCGACIGKNSFCYHIYRIDNYEDRGYNKIGFDSNEEAVEAALKYTLNNLL